MGEVKVFFGFLAGWRDLSRALIFSTCSRRYSRAVGTRMPWHPVPSRAALAVLAVQATYDLQSVYFFCLSDLRSAYQTAFGLYPLLFYKESALFFDFSFWLHQGRIPHRMCRFHCCLAAHQRTKEKDSAEPLSSILWTPPPHPGVIRCGGAYLLPRLTGI